MIIFVPSWYDKAIEWHAHYGPWHHKKSEYEFDDTINQIRVFRTAGENIGIMCLSYMPCLRHFLHRQCIYPTEYWSVFDEMQGIAFHNPSTLSYLDLEWPHNVEWIYTQKDVRAYVNGGLHAIVEFYRDGGLCWIDYYQKEEIKRRDIYDDRGFCSSSLYFFQEKPVKREYLGVYGDSRFSENLVNGEITISQEDRHRFKKCRYESLSEVIAEKIKEWLAKVEESTIILAADHLHNQIIMDGCRHQTIVLSFFEERYCLNDKEKLKKDTARVAFAVTDTERSARILRESEIECDVYDISPFDTRLPLGESQTIREQRIFMPVDGLVKELLEKALRQIFDYMHEHEEVYLMLGVNADDDENNQMIAETAGKMLNKLEYSEITYGRLFEEYMEIEPDEKQQLRQENRIRVQICTYSTENDLIDILSRARLVVDVRDQPDLYLQIAGISSGIPQVNYRFTRYVEHQKNGFIIQNIDHVTEALEYYLSTLSNWNEALVYCVQTASQYAGGALVEKWRTLLSNTSWDY